jgi:hypothetical protein
MTSKANKSMQKPLVDEGFEDLLTRLIQTNRADRAQRDKASRSASAELRGEPRKAATPANGQGPSAA